MYKATIRISTREAGEESEEEAHGPQKLHQKVVGVGVVAGKQGLGQGRRHSLEVRDNALKARKTDDQCSCVDAEQRQDSEQAYMKREDAQLERSLE